MENKRSVEFEATPADNIECFQCNLKIKSMSGQGQPGPGALLLCGGCGALMVLDENLQPRKLDAEERQQALESEAIRLARQIIRGRSRGRASKLN